MKIAFIIQRWTEEDYEAGESDQAADAIYKLTGGNNR